MTDERSDETVSADDQGGSDEETSLPAEIHQVEYDREPPPKSKVRKIHKRRKAPEVPEGKPVADNNPSPPPNLLPDSD